MSIRQKPTFLVQITRAETWLSSAFPALPTQVINFSPALYDFVTKQMKKNIILVLNKIDLAPPSLVVAWKYYFKSQFPEVHVVCFTSYPQQDQDPSAGISI